MAIVKPQFPTQVWDGLSANIQRQNRRQNHEPEFEDWDQIVAEVISVEQFVQGLSAGNFSWRGNWDNVTQYVENDAVQHLGTSYIAVAASQNSEPPSANWNVLAAAGQNGVDGDDGNDGISFVWQGTWSNVTTYAANDVVEYQGSAYISLVASNLNNQPDVSPSEWDLMAQKGADGQDGQNGTSFTFQGAWSGAATYASNDVVIHKSSSWRSKTSSNTNNEPPNATHWDLMVVGINFRGAWSSLDTYEVNDVATINGNAYIAVAQNTNSQPPSANWSLLAEKGDAGSLNYTPKVANYTAVNGDLVGANTSGGTFTVTLPVSPAANELIGVKLEVAGNNLTIDRNGKNIEGQAANLVLSIAGDIALLQYDGIDNWVRITTTPDHGLLAGLGDDDHPQYLLVNGSRAGTGTQELQGLNFTDATELTISSGAITKTQTFHRIDTEADAGTDNLDTIQGGAEGDVIVIRPEVASRQVTLTIAGNIALPFDTTYEIPDNAATVLIFDGTKWRLVNQIFAEAAGGGGSGLAFTTVKTSNYTAAAGEYVRCDVNTTGSFTVTLPGSPSANDLVGVILTVGSGSNTVSIDGNGNTIEGNHDSKLYIEDDYLVFMFDGTEWQTVDDGLRPHACKLSRDASQSIATSTVTKIAFDTEVFDYGQIGDVATNDRVTIRRPGRYAIFGGGAIFQIPDTEVIQSRIRLNATNIRTDTTMSGVNDSLSVASQALVDAAAGDTIELDVYQTAGGNRDTGNTAGSRMRLEVHEVR